MIPDWCLCALAEKAYYEFNRELGKTIGLFQVVEFNDLSDCVRNAWKSVARECITSYMELESEEPDYGDLLEDDVKGR